MNKKADTYPSKKSKFRHHLPAEWVTFSVACLIVMILVGLVLYTWITQEDKPPILSVSSPQSIREVQGQYYVPFTVKNTGGGTAESVQVTGELILDERIEESGEQQIDFLSGGETKEGAFIFSHNPQKGKLVLRVASYKLP
ncbi:conserved hypothetical protein [Gloeothece citriformis PCC 7424]|uniref:TIGR02588 family protein n=1 Tax=Gloeothece citriformis (strain PCC 7424) TaxID=65393 RepID=B7KHM6_GLOC7|nr:TIGR02588 family protein [Gloeothece citriformis]ACK70721.1 conserved hypothetical protein [Gloeothece citriformis PCC 7424]